MSGWANFRVSCVFCDGCWVSLGLWVCGCDIDWHNHGSPLAFYLVLFWWSTPFLHPAVCSASLSHERTHFCHLFQVYFVCDMTFPRWSRILAKIRYDFSTDSFYQKILKWNSRKSFRNSSVFRVSHVLKQPDCKTHCPTSVAHLTRGGGQGPWSAPPRQIKGGKKANTPPPFQIFFEIFSKNVSKGETLWKFLWPLPSNRVRLATIQRSIRRELFRRVFPVAFLPLNVQVNIRYSVWSKLWRTWIRSMSARRHCSP